MRTVTISYEGLGELEIQIATGKKLFEVTALAKQLSQSEKPTEAEDEKDFDLMCEIVAKCTKFSKEEVYETLGIDEITEIVQIIRGNREAIKKAQSPV